MEEVDSSLPVHSHPRGLAQGQVLGQGPAEVLLDHGQLRPQGITGGTERGPLTAGTVPTYLGLEVPIHLHRSR